MNTIYILRYVGLLETLAFKFSNDTGRWGFKDVIDWGIKPWK